MFLFPKRNANGNGGADGDRTHVKVLPVKPPKVTLLLRRRPSEWLLWKSLSDVALTRSPETID